MKKPRKFYPRQVLRRLAGDHTSISPETEARLLFLLRLSRKLGYSVSVFPAVDPDVLQQAPATLVLTALANANTRIILQPSV